MFFIKHYECQFWLSKLFLFFSVWVSFQEHSRITEQEGKEEAFFSSSLPLHALPKLFRLQRSQLLERFKDERRLCKRIQEPYSVFFIIKTSIRVNKGARFLDVLLNVNFQPLVTKQSFIKIYVTELLDPPQAFTCWEI